MIAATVTRFTIEELLEAMFSVRSVPRRYNKDMKKWLARNEWMSIDMEFFVNIGDTYIDINPIIGLGISGIAQVPNLIQF